MTRIPSFRIVCAVGYLVLALAGGCRVERDVTRLGDNFGLAKQGGGLPHAPTVVSLLHRDKRDWEIVWPAISFRCDSPIAWKDAVVFGAVTTHEAIDADRVRLLYYDPQTGVVDVTEPILYQARMGNKAAPAFIKLKREDIFAVITLVGAQPVDMRISLAELEEMARAVVSKNRKREFDGAILSE